MSEVEGSKHRSIVYQVVSGFERICTTHNINIFFTIWTWVNEILKFQHDSQFSLLDPATKSIAINYPAVQAWFGGGIWAGVLILYFDITGIHTSIVLFARG